jgi:hypothetical protein
MPTQVDVPFFKKISIFWFFPMMCVPVRYQGKELEPGFMLTTAPSLHPRAMGFSIQLLPTGIFSFLTLKFNFHYVEFPVTFFRITF